MFDIPNLGFMRTWVDANGWTIIDHRDSMEWIPPEGWFERNRPSPEEERRMAEFIAEWMRTHPPVVFFVRFVGEDERGRMKFVAVPPPKGDPS